MNRVTHDTPVTYARLNPQLSARLNTRSNARLKRRLGSSASAAVLATALAAGVVSTAWANPRGGEVVTGEASIAGEGTPQVTVTQASERAFINWESFSIAADEAATFRQPSATSITANRVMGIDPSTILGRLSANGRLVLINRNGVLFGKGARVDAGGLVATVHDLDPAAFMAGGPLRFEDGGVKGASVINAGRITVSDAGLAALVAPQVKNAGVIQADLGRVALGSGSGFTLDLYGDGLIHFAVGDEVAETLTGADGQALDALVVNAGEISAAGGRVLLSAAAAREVVNRSVNLGGVVRAASIDQSKGVITLSGSGAVHVETGAVLSASGAAGGGRIEIEAGSLASDGFILAEGTPSRGAGGVIDIAADTVSLGGRVSASGQAGGAITVDAQQRLSLAETVQAVGALGAGGEIAYRAGRLTETSTGVTDASGLTHGGKITVTAERQVATSGDYLADGLYGRGGRIDMTAGDVRLLSAGLAARGRIEGGQVRVGGAFQGGKTPDPAKAYYDSFLGRWTDSGPLASARANFINDATRIDVSSHGGRGGTAIVWSEVLTTFLGGIDARGVSGGGSVGISSAEDLRRADLGNVKVGAGGHLLLDPKNIVIGKAADISAWSYAGVLGAGYVRSASANVGGLGVNDQFGTSVALNAAGNRLAVGAPGDDGAAGSTTGDAGAVYLFSFTDTNFSGGTLEATIGKGYAGGKNVDVPALEASDGFGSSVSLNAAGDRLAVGAPKDDSAGPGASDSGAVYLFSFADGNFSSGALTATLGKGYTGSNNVDVSALVQLDAFGTSVSLNGTGNRLAVGAPGDDGAAGSTTTNAGAVYLFSFSDTDFTGGTLTATVGKGYTAGKDVDVTALEAEDRFGQSVALNASGNRLAVGAYFDDGQGNAALGTGAVYLFSFSDTDFTGGALEATLGKGYTGGKNVDVTALRAGGPFSFGDSFGYSVSLNAAGDRLAVGAVFDNGSRAPRTGAVYLFTFSDANFSGGTLAATVGQGDTGGRNINVSALGNNDQFGTAVALNAAGDRLAVGAPFDDGATGSAPTNAGAVYLFSFANGNFSGGALSGTLGAGYTGNKNVNVGVLPPGARFGTTVAALQAGDQSGTSVALNADGNRLAVGALFDDGSNDATDAAGAVYLFSFIDANFSGGKLEATLGKGYTGGKNIDVGALGAGDLFGTSVALNAAGNRLAVGAPGDAGSGNTAANAGAVYLFSFTDNTFSGGALAATLGQGYTNTTTATAKNLDIGALAAGDQFGASVALNGAGDRLAVGAALDPGAKNAGTAVGAVYLFSFADNTFSSGTLEATLGQGYTTAMATNNVDVSALQDIDLFGASVSLNEAGDRLAVGATGDDGSGDAARDSGAVYLFSFTANTRFAGGALAATVGKGYTNAAATGKNVDVDALQAGDQFGQSVALNADGNRLAVGAPFDDGAGNALRDSGAAYLFSFADNAFSGGTRAGTLGAGYTGGNNRDIAALEVGDRFGTALALNGAGNRFAVGAPGDDGAADKRVNHAGAVYLLSFTNTGFAGGALRGVVGKDAVNGGTLGANDWFGASVALNAAGDRLAVGARFDDGAAGRGAANAGAVYLFSFTDKNFSGGKLEATLGKGYTGGKNVDVSALTGDSFPSFADNFGRSVSLNAAGDRLAVGAPGDDGADSLTTNGGAVYLFSFTDTSFSSGMLEATLGKGYSGGKNRDVGALGVLDRFGESVSLNAAGNRLAVGAPFDDGATGSSTGNGGAVYLFSFADTNFSGGTLEATFGKDYTTAMATNNVDVSVLEGNDSFGASVSLNGAGDRLAVGADGDDGATNADFDTGAVYLFSFSDGNFSNGRLTATVGKGYTTGKDVDVGTLDAGVTGAGDSFGFSVSLNAAGDRLAVGAPRDDSATNVRNDIGAVYLFSFTDGNFSGGKREATLGSGYTGGKNVNVPGLAADDHQFGSGVALNAAGDRLAVGAPKDDGAGNTVSNSGAVYLFTALTAPLNATTAFTDNQSDTVTVAAADIVSLLGAGTAVTLQASNDVTLAEAIRVTGTPSAIGALTLQAGRSLLLNADIATAAGSGAGLTGGAVTLIANDLLANGVVDAERDAGAAVIAMAAGTSINAGPGAVSIQLRDGTGKTNRASGDIALGSITADTISVVNNGPTAGSGVTLNTGAVLSAAATSGTAIDIAGDVFTNNAGAGALVTSGSGRFLVWSGDPSADNRGGLAHDFKQYNATRGTTTVAGAAGEDGFLYTLAPTVTVGPTLTGTVTKTYDGTNTATLAAGNYVVSGAVDGDTVNFTSTSATYDNKNVNTDPATRKTVTASGLALAGASNGSVTVYGYQLAPTSSTSASGAVGVIERAPLTLRGLTAVDKVYDATRTASLNGTATLAGTVFGSDTVMLTGTSATGTFADKNVGTNKVVTVSGYALAGADASNYMLTQPTGLTADITAAMLTLNGVMAADKVYDATTTASLSGGTLAGVLGSDTVMLNRAGAMGTFADKNVGTNKAVTVSGYALTGADASNYMLTQPTGLAADITAAMLTLNGVMAADKVYDATTTASLSGGMLAGVLGSDTVTLNRTGAMGTFADKNVGTGKAVTVSGYALTGADASNYMLTQPTGLTADITAAMLTLNGVMAADKVYDATTTASLTGTATLVGTVFPGDSVTLIGTGAMGTFADKNVGTNKAVTVSGYALTGADASNYMLTQPTGLAADITAAMLTLSGVMAADKVYDATTTASLSGGTLAGVLGSDTVTLNRTGAMGTFADKNVGTNKAVTVSGYALAGTDASNYTLTQPTGLAADITAAMLTLSGVMAADKVYDATTTASLSGGMLAGVLGSDTVTLNRTGAMGTFADKNVGTGKAVTVSGYALTGADASNYMLTQPTGLTADITAAMLTLNGVMAADKVYDATTTASLTGTATLVGTVFPGDSVTLIGTGAMGTFADKNVGTNKVVTVSGYALAGADASNYMLTQPTGLTADITAAMLTLNGVMAADKVYDATTTASLSGGTLAGVLGSDTVTLNRAGAMGTFADKNVGTNKAVTVSGYALAGTDASNYTLTQPTGLAADITAAMLTLNGVMAADKVYDATTTASLSGGMLAGVLGSDTVTLNRTGAMGTFADKNVGTGKAVTVSGYALTGADASNYMLTQPTGLTADITAAMLTLNGVMAADKVYDATTTASLTGTATLVGTVFPGDSVTLIGTGAMGTFADKNVGTNKAVTVSGYALAGTDASNYMLTQPTGLTADITAAMLTLNGVMAADKVYDATTTASLSGGMLAGVLGSDTVTLNRTGAMGTFADKNVGTNKAVTVSGYALAGTDASNYTLTQPTGLAADITAAMLTLNGVMAADKVYDATTTASLSGGALAGVFSGDTVNLNRVGAMGTFADKNVGTNKAVTVSGYALAGTDASNYTLTQPTGLTADITAAMLTLNGVMAADKVYDATTTASLSGGMLAGVLGSDTVTLNRTGAMGTFADKNVGTNKAVTVSGYALAGTDASNYTLTQPTGLTANITAATLTVIGVSAADKVYDATRTASLNGTATLAGVLAGDTVTLNRAGAMGTFADKNVGTNKPVTVLGYTHAGTDAGNYVLTQPMGLTANITPAMLTAGLTGLVTKTYDRSIAATLMSSNYTLAGILGADAVGLNNPASGIYDTVNVGTNKIVSVSGLALFGTDARNYVLASTSVSGAVGVIDRAPLILTGVSAADKVYDATTMASLSGGALAGVFSGDTVNLNRAGAMGTFADKNVGTGKAVTVSGYALAGANAGNYVLTQPTGLTANISAAMLTVTGVSAADKVYDATTMASLSGGALAGVFSGDTVNLNRAGAMGTFADKNVGTGKAVTASGYALSGADAGNYVLTQPMLNADITAALLTVRVNDAQRRRNDPDPAFTYAISGFVGGEDAGLVSGLSTATDAGPDSPAGTYRIFARDGVAPNYRFAYVDGVLTVLVVGREAVGFADDPIIHADPEGGTRGGPCPFGAAANPCSVATVAEMLPTVREIVPTVRIGDTAGIYYIGRAQ